MIGIVEGVLLAYIRSLIITSNHLSLMLNMSALGIKLQSMKDNKAPNISMINLRTDVLRGGWLVEVNYNYNMVVFLMLLFLLFSIFDNSVMF